MHATKKSDAYLLREPSSKVAWKNITVTHEPVLYEEGSRARYNVEASSRRPVATRGHWEHTVSTLALLPVNDSCT